LIRVFTITEEWQPLPEVMIAAVKVIGRIVKFEATIDQVIATYPNIGNFLIGMLKENQDVEILIALKNLSQHTKYHKNINPPEIKSVQKARKISGKAN
jgi:hypothetical protein